jgi:small subunit ribosomal protein S20
MPIKKNAKKYMKSSAKRWADNQKVKKSMKAAIKEVKKLIDDKKIKKAKESYKKAQKAIDKAAKKNIIKENNAARKKSRLTKQLTKSKK